MTTDENNKTTTSTTTNSTTTEYSKNDIKAIFADEKVDDTIIEGFKDRVRAVHEHFDKDNDGYLNFIELAALQRITEGVKLSEQNYVMACKTLLCEPSKGISIDALKLTYASDGASIDKDYYKVFPEKRPKKKKGKDHVYEVGDDGFDISD